MYSVFPNLNTLPVELRAIIEDDEIVSIIDDIGEEFDIPSHWRSGLLRATVDILRGKMRPGSFIPFIIEEYNLVQEDALQIALLVNERIFSAVKPQLASLHNIEDDKLAHRLRVPHKPRNEEETAIDSYDVITYENESELEKVGELEESIYVPSTPIIAPKEAPVDYSPNTNVSIEDKTVKSALSEKLGGMKIDQYREKF